MSNNNVADNKINHHFSVQVEVLNSDDNLVFYRGLLSKDECDHMIRTAEPHMARSQTFSGGNDKRRTSSSVFGNKFYTDPVMRAIMERCATLVGYPVSHVELPQVVRYHTGELYMNHSDVYPDGSPSLEKSGQRDYTFFIYLNEPSPGQSGGETVFSDQEIYIKPERGMGVMWRNVDIANNQNLDYGKIVHNAQPPSDWTKYGMNVWIRHKKWIG